MKTGILILALCCATLFADSTSVGTETIHDNFRPAGLQIDGSGWFRQGESAALYGKCGLFVWDGFQLSLTLGTSAEKGWHNSTMINNTKETRHTYHYFSKDLTVLSRLDATYFWGYKRGKTDRLVHSIGSGIEIGYDRGSIEKSDTVQGDTIGKFYTSKLGTSREFFF